LNAAVSALVTPGARVSVFSKTSNKIKSVAGLAPAKMTKVTCKAGFCQVPLKTSGRGLLRRLAGRRRRISDTTACQPSQWSSQLAATLTRQRATISPIIKHQSTGQSIELL
jgi:hypothetical protein